MAKANGVSPIEEHLEKVVVGLCALLFAFGLFHWGLSSPRRIGSMPDVSINGIDERILQQAQEVEREAARQVAPPEIIPDYIADVQKLQKLQGVDYGAGLAEVGTASRTIWDPPKLQVLGPPNLDNPLPVPEAPLVLAGVDLPFRGKEVEEFKVAHGVVVFPYSQMKPWLERLKKFNIPDRFTAIELEVQVQEKLPDGTWSEERPIKTTGLDMTTEALNAAETARKIKAFSGTSPEAITSLVKGAEGMQSLVLMPDYWPVRDFRNDIWMDWKSRLPAAMLAELRGSETPMPTSPNLPATVKIAAIAMDAQKTTLGKVYTWFHDMGLESNKQYRYRARLVFANPLLNADPAKIAKPAQAKIPTFPTPWSEWSSEVSVVQENEFYLMGDTKSAGEGTVAVFTYCLGQAVTQEFRVQPGQTIGKTVNLKVSTPGGTSARRDVDFSTGSIVVGFDFDKRNNVKNTAEMIYLDKDGILRRRVEASDKASDAYRNWAGAVRKARRP